MGIGEMTSLYAVVVEENRVSEIYTIGSSKSTAENFFKRLRENGIEVVLDVRLKTNSQLAAFAKAPDIRYFVEEIASARYIYDEMLAPSAEILEAYRRKEIDWAGYELRFEELMHQRKIDMHILRTYADANEKKYCILCSEESADYCHRRLVAQRIAAWFGLRVIHL